MGFKLEISVKARKDVEAAVNWYNAQIPKLGKKFVNEFRDSLGYIQNYPFAFKEFDGVNREVPLKIFPYLIIYEVQEYKIIILGVFNTHQNPTKKT